MARARMQGRVRLVGVARRTRSALMVSTALQAVFAMVLAVPADAQPKPNAQPTGGIVVGGSATISQTTNNTAINQASQRAAINWRSFDVGSKQSVTFQQPNAQSIALNTVTGGNPSQIAGSINANGQVVLVNQSGVTFFKGAQVNTAGLMVSASGANTAQFMAGGKIAFDRPGNADARIVNNGNITISGAGLAALVAPSVRNAGVIDAKLGHVVLAGAKTATLDLYGDKLLNVNVTGAMTRAPDGGEAMVTNAGVIRADGGTVRLTARAVDGVVTNLVSAGGTIQARTIGDKQGRITIDGVGGSITITGNLDATGKAAGTKGGQIGLLASDSVIVKTGAVVDASGAAGGGVVAVGTTLKRALGVPTQGAAVAGERMARGVLVEHGAVISADATSSGDGGRITLLSSAATAMQGTITAKGGPAGGDGGWVEVSGGLLALTGMVDASAPKGHVGSLLMDPSDLYISNTRPTVNGTLAADANGVATIAAGGSPDGATVSWVDPAQLAALNANISLAATNNLFAASGSVTPNTLDIGTHDLTLTAGGSLTVDRGFTLNAANISLTATAGSITMNGTSGVDVGLITGPQLAALGVSKLTGTTVTLAAATGIALADAAIGTSGTPVTTFNVSVGTSGGVTQAPAGAINVTTVGSPSGVVGAATLAGTSNAIASVGSFAATGGDFSLVGTGNLGVAGPLTAANVALSAPTITATGSIGALTTLTLSSGAGGIRLNAGEILSGATVDLSTTGGGVTQVASGTITASVLRSTGKVAGAVSLAGIANAIASIGSFAVTGAGAGFALTTAGPLAVNDALSAASGDVVLRSTGTLGGITIGGAGAVTVSGSNTASFRADAFANAGTVTGGTFEYSVDTPGVLNLGANIASLAGIGTSNVRFGAAVGAITANSITLSADFDLGSRPLDLRSNGDISDGGTNSLKNVATLTGSVVSGSVSLTGPATGIGAIGDFAVGGAGGFTVKDAAGILAVTGNLSGTVIALAAPDIAVSGLISTGSSSTGSVSLTANPGTISGAGTITTGTLTGSATGAASLTGANQIGTLGAFAAAALTLNDGVALTIANSVSAAGTVSLTSTDLLAINSGQTVIGSDVTLQGTGLTIGGLVSATATADLIAGAGGIDETAGTIAAGTLTGSAGALANLTGASPAANQIANLGAFTATGGSLVLNDGTSLNVTGNVSAPSGDIVLRSVGVSNGGTGTGISIAATNTLAAAALTGTVSVRADTFSAVTGKVTGGVFEFAQDTAGALTIGAGGAIADLTGIVTPVVRLGSVRNAGTPIATSITLTRDLDLGAGTGTSAALDLQATGAIDSGGFRLLNVTTLTGVSNSGSVSLGNIGNSVASLGNFTAGGAFTLGDGVDLAVTGLLSASQVALTAKSITLDIPGAITTGGGNTGSVSLIASATTIGGTGAITTGTLTGAAIGTISLTGANQIGVLGTFSAAAIFLNDGAALTVANTVSATGTVSLTSTDLLTVNTGQTITGSDVTLQGTALAIGGLVSATGTADLIATAGGIDETAGSIVAGSLIGSVFNSATLTGASLAANRIGNLGAFTATNGGIALTDGISFKVTGDVSAAKGDVVLRSVAAINGGTGGTIAILGTSTLASALGTGTVSVRADKFTVGTGTITGGIFEYAQDTPGVLTIGVGGALVDLTGIQSGRVRLGSAQGSITANGLTLASNLDLQLAGVSRALDLFSTVSIDDGGGANAVLNVSTLSGVANTGSVSLSNVNNSVATLGVFTVGKGFTFTDSLDLTIVNGLTAAPVTLKAPNITINATIDTTGGAGALNATALTATGTISEGGGAIDTGLLTGAAGGTVTLSGPNKIDTLGTFSAAAFTLNDGVALAITNTVSATGTVSLTSSGLLTINSGQAVIGSDVTLQGTGLTIGGLVSATATVDLIAAAGGIDETAGSIVAATLTGTTGAQANLTGASATANQIGTLGAFTAGAGGITLVDGQTLTIANDVSATGAVAITSAGALSVNATKTVTGSDVTFNGTDITINGAVSAGGGTVSLLASGTISEPGTLTALTLTGSAGVSADLSGTNAITNLGSFKSGGSFTVLDGSALTINNTVSAVGTVTLTSSGQLTILATDSVIGTGVSLSGTGLTIGGLVSDGGAGSVNLVATTGAITESGQLIAGTLTGSAGTSATLSGANTIAALGSFTAKDGAFALNDLGPLTVSGPVSGSTGVTIQDSGPLSITGTVTAVAGNVVLGSTGTNGIAINAGSVIATGNTVSVSAATLAFAGGGTISADTFEFGPGVNGGTVTLGGGGGLSVASIGARNIRIGRVAGTTDAGAIVIAGFNAGAASLELDASGAVSETGALISAGPVTGTAGSYTLTDPGNKISQLGGGTLAGGTLSTSGGGISVLDATPLTLAGLVSAGTGTVDLSTSGGFSITQGSTAALTAGILTSTSGISGSLGLLGTSNAIGTISALTATGGLTVVDNRALVLAGAVGSGPGATVDITTTKGSGFGVTQDATGVLTAGTLTSTGDISGALVLRGTANAIGTINNLTAAGLTVADNQALTLAGTVSAGAGGILDISTTAGQGFGVTQTGGIVTAATLTSAGGISGNVSLSNAAIGTIDNLTATGLTIVDNQALTLAGAVSVGTAGTVDIKTTAGGVSQASAADTLIAGVFKSSGGIAGAVNLPGTLNSIGTITGVTAQSLTVVDNHDLTLAGLVSVGTTGTVDITTTSGSGFNVSQVATDTLIAGVLTSTGGISGTVILQGTANQIGTINNLTAGGTLTLVDSNPLILSGLVSVGTVGLVDITTSAGASVTQASTDTLIAGTLHSTGGISGNLALDGTANQIGTIDGVTVLGGQLTVVDSKSLTLSGLVKVGAAGTGTLDISTSAGADLTQTSGPLLAGTLTSATGIGGSAILQDTTIGTLGNFTATGSLAMVDSIALTIADNVGASAGNVFLTTGTNQLSFAPGGSLVSQSGGTIGILADSLGNIGVAGATGIVNAGAAGVFEFAPFTATDTVTLGAAVGPSLSTTAGITAGTLRIGAVTRPFQTITAVGAAAIAISGPFDAGGRALELDATGAVTQTAALLNVGTLIGTAASYTLANAGNTIGQIGGGTLTASSGTLAVIEAGPLIIAGTVSAAGNIFIGSGTNAMTFATGGSVISNAAGGTIALQAGSLTNLGGAAATGVVRTNGGLFELAPGATGDSLTLGAGAGLSLIDLTGISAGSLRFGAVTLPGSLNPTTFAGPIAVTSTFDVKNLRLELDATGAVTQAAPLLNVATLTGTAGSFTLTNPGNTIAQIGDSVQSAALTANTGTLAIVDNADLTAAFSIKAGAGNIFLKTSAGHTLTVAGAILSQAGGTIGIQTDRVIGIGTTPSSGTVNTGGGLFELAPSSAIVETLGAAAGLSLTDLSGITAATLRIGAVTLPGDANPTTTASSIAVAGTFDAQNLRLELDATGAVTQSAPLINVATLTGTAGSYTLTNAGNAIGQIGGGTLTATSGTLAVVDSTNLNLSGTIKATTGNVFLATAAGKALTFGSAASVIAQGGGRIGILSDSVLNLGTTLATGAVNAGAGLFELAPVSPIGETLGVASGLSLANLTGITAGEVRIGAVTLPGGTIATTSATSISIAGTFDAGGRALDLDATGAVTQSAPLLNVSTLTGTAGLYTLTNAGNSIGQIGGDTLIATSGSIAVLDNFALTVAGTVQSVAGDVFLRTAAGDTVTFAAQGGTILSVPGGTIGIETDGLVNLGTTGATGVVNAGAAGLFELAPVSPAVGVVLGGPAALSLTNLTNITTGTLRIGAVTQPGAGAFTVTAGSISIPGVFDTASLRTLDLEANGPITEGAGGAIVNLASLIVSNNGAPGDIALGNTSNVIGTIVGDVRLTAGNVTFGDTPASGTFTISPGQTISANNVAMTILGGLAENGVITAIGVPGNVSLVALGGVSDLTFGAGSHVGANGTVSLTAGRTLAQAGGSIEGGSVTAVAGGLVSVGGSILGGANGSVGAVSLRGDSISITGTVSDGGAGTVSLVASGGSINEPSGALIAGTLTGSSAGATTLTGNPSGNQVGVLGNFSAAGFTLDDFAPQLLVTGNIASAGGFTLVETGALVVQGQASIGASAVDLLAVNGSGIGNATIAGTVISTGTAAITTPGSLTISGIVEAANGVSINSGEGMSETGTIASSAGAIGIGVTGSLTLAGLVSGQTGVTIIDTGTMVAGGAIVSPGGSVAITDTGGLTSTGLVSGLSGVSINSGGGMSATGTIASAAGAIGIGVTGPLNLAALVSGQTGVTIIDTGTMIAGGAIVSPGGSVAITDTGGLTSTGLVSGLSGVSINSGGGMSATGTIASAAGAIGIGVTGPLNLAALVSGQTGVTIIDTGTMIAGGAIVSPGGAIGIADTGGLTVTGFVSGLTGVSISATGDMFVAGTVISSAGAVAVADGGTLNIPGLVSGRTAAIISAGGSLSVAGSVSAPAVSLTGASLSLAGVVTDGGAGTVNLIATSGTINETGLLVAGTLTGNSPGATTLTGTTATTNQVATLGNFIASGFTLNDGEGLTVSGVLIGGPSARITSSLSLTVGGAVAASAINLTAASIAIPGVVTDGGAGTVSLIATGGTIDETGALVAGTLSGSATGSASLAGITPTTNQVATLSNFSSASFVLNDGRSLLVTGQIAAGSGFTLTDTGNLTFGPSSSVTAGSVVVTDTGNTTIAGAIASSGTIAVDTTGGSLNAPGRLLGETGVGLTDTGGVLSLANTSSIASGNSIVITDLAAVVLAGTISAPRIIVNNQGGSATVLDGTTIQTSGVPRPPGGALTVEQLDLITPSPTSTVPGLFIGTGQLVQNGALTVTGSPSTVRIDASGGIQFANAPGGLIAPNSAVVLELSNNAQATGNIVVGGLDTAFTGSSRGIGLSGSVAGLTGPAAAGAARIAPNTNAAFRINGCPIASINCVILTTQGIPAASPLRDFVIGFIYDPNDDDDLLLPLVSDEVY